MKMIRNRRTGLSFPLTAVLEARLEHDRDLELVEGDVPVKVEKAQEPALPIPLDINQATAEQIAKVATGIKLGTAQAIVDRVAKKGPFRSLDELTEIKGLGNATISRNLELLKV
jgi:competence protein ComEA